MHHPHKLQGALHPAAVARPACLQSPLSSFQTTAEPAHHGVHHLHVCDLFKVRACAFDVDFEYNLAP
jgi:hypothetical protein